MGATSPERGVRVDLAFRIVAAISGPFFAVPSVFFALASLTQEDQEVHMVHKLAGIPESLLVVSIVFLAMGEIASRRSRQASTT